MPTVGYSAKQRKGKTTKLVRDYLWLLSAGSYTGYETISNLKIDVKGLTFVDNERMKYEMYHGLAIRQDRHKIYIVDDASSVFPARGYSDKTQSEILQHIWKDSKLFNYIMFSSHVGKSVDLILDNATNYLFIPSYDKESGRLPYDVILCDEKWFESGCLSSEQVKYCQNVFDSWEPAPRGEAKFLLR